MRIFDDDGAREGVGLLHHRFQFTLGNVLDILVNGQDDVVPRLGLFLDAGKPVLVGID